MSRPTKANLKANCAGLQAEPQAQRFSRAMRLGNAVSFSVSAEGPAVGISTKYLQEPKDSPRIAPASQLALRARGICFPTRLSAICKAIDRYETESNSATVDSSINMLVRRTVTIKQVSPEIR